MLQSQLKVSKLTYCVSLVLDIMGIQMHSPHFANFPREHVILCTGTKGTKASIVMQGRLHKACVHAQAMLSRTQDPIHQSQQQH